MLGIAAWVALGAAAVPFLASFRTTESSASSISVDGQVVASSGSLVSHDYVALAFGALAVMAALWAGVGGFKAEDRRTQRLGIAAAALGCGAVHCLRGANVV